MSAIEFIVSALLILALSYVAVRFIVAIVRVVWYTSAGFLWASIGLFIIYMLFR